MILLCFYLDKAFSPIKIYFLTFFSLTNYCIWENLYKKLLIIICIWLWNYYRLVVKGLRFNVNTLVLVLCYPSLFLLKSEDSIVFIDLLRLNFLCDVLNFGLHVIGTCNWKRYFSNTMMNSSSMMDFYF